MSDKIGPLKPREDGTLHIDDLKLDHFIAVLKSLSPDRSVACPTCDSTKWDVHRDPDTSEEEDVPALVYMSSVRKPLLAQRILFTSCAKCGHMRTFTAERILELASKLDEQQ